jgi:hypothetical protein
MTNAYIYKLHKFYLFSSIEIPLLEQVKNNITNNELIIKLNIHHNIYNQDQIKDKYLHKDIYYIDFGANLIYIIHKQNNLIEAYTDNNENIITSFFNVPLSLYLVRYNGILLHASTIEINRRIIGFCGDKGAGKSTMVMLLSKKYNLFSDDTIYIESEDDNIIALSANRFTRLTKETFNIITRRYDFDKFPHNIIGKAYIFPDKIGLKSSDSDRGILSALFIINRSNIDSIRIEKVTSLIAKKIAVWHNIVGINYFDDRNFLVEINTELIETLIAKIAFYRLLVPNNILCLEKFIDENMIPILSNIGESIET